MIVGENRLNQRPAVRFGLIILGLLAWVAAGLAAETAPLPAKDWNPRQVERLKAPAGDTLTFAVLGDSRSNPAVFAAVLKALAGDPSLDFAIELGDMVERGTLEQFDAFFQQIRSVVRLPFLTVAGNHDLGKDRDLTLYRDILGPDYYAFQLKGNYFIMVNDEEAGGVGEVQWRWLEGELKKSQSYQTRLVFLHTPLFDPRGGDNHHCLPESAGRRLAALFLKYHVSHVFAGHIHSYFAGQWDGVPFTVTAGAGGPLCGTDPAHFFYHYLKVTLRGDQIDVQVQRLSTPGEK